MYAIVKAGGHQEKVEVGDVILVNRLDAKNRGIPGLPRCRW